MNQHFGEHLTIDGYNGNPDSLGDEQVVTQFLKQLPADLGMHILEGPVVTEAPDTGAKDPGGWSGFVIIAESHISIHTFPKRKFLSADVYTCQNGLDVDTVLEKFKTSFGITEIEQNFIIRGTNYPNSNIV